MWYLVGVPGVKPERLEEGMTIQHCALSLVGRNGYCFILYIITEKL